MCVCQVKQRWLGKNYLLEGIAGNDIMYVCVCQVKQRWLGKNYLLEGIAGNDIMYCVCVSGETEVVR